MIRAIEFYIFEYENTPPGPLKREQERSLGLIFKTIDKRDDSKFQLSNTNTAKKEIPAEFPLKGSKKHK
jgi:hypothetical protein